jgi:hypothetical protein
MQTLWRSFSSSRDEVDKAVKWRRTSSLIVILTFWDDSNFAIFCVTIYTNVGELLRLKCININNGTAWPQLFCDSGLLAAVKWGKAIKEPKTGEVKVSYEVRFHSPLAIGTRFFKFGILRILERYCAAYNTVYHITSPAGSGAPPFNQTHCYCCSGTC